MQKILTLKLPDPGTFEHLSVSPIGIAVLSRQHSRHFCRADILCNFRIFNIPVDPDSIGRAIIYKESVCSCEHTLVYLKHSRIGFSQPGDFLILLKKTVSLLLLHHFFLLIIWE